jgi:hypothetical protein
LCSPDAGEAGRLALPLKIVKINSRIIITGQSKINYIYLVELLEMGDFGEAALLEMVLFFLRV